MARSAGRERERTVCDTCDLPYYADGEGCPYCDSVATADEAVDHGEPEEGEESEFVFGDAEPDADAAAGEDSGGGLVGRLKRTLGL